MIKSLSCLLFLVLLKFFEAGGGASRAHLTYERGGHVTRGSVTTKMAAKKQSDRVILCFLVFLLGSCQSLFYGAETYKRQVRKSQQEVCENMELKLEKEPAQ